MISLNGDGFPDIIASVDGYFSDPGMLVYFQNDGTGNFGEATVLTDTLIGDTAYIDVSDMDGDGRMDIVVAAADSDLVFVFYQEADNTYQFSGVDFNLEEKYMKSINVVDLTGNGLGDIVIYSTYGITIYWNEGARQFTRDEVERDTSPYIAADAEELESMMYDINGDGFPDILFTQSSSLSLDILVQHEDRVFLPSKKVIPDGHVSAFVIGDVNNDDVDDLIVNNGSSNRIEV